MAYEAATDFYGKPSHPYNRHEPQFILRIL